MYSKCIEQLSYVDRGLRREIPDSMLAKTLCITRLVRYAIEIKKKIDWELGLSRRFLFEHPHLSQATPHLSFRAGWRYHAAENGSELPKHQLIYRNSVA